MAWQGMLWFSMPWHALACHEDICCGMPLHDSACHAMPWHAMAIYATIGMACYGMPLLLVCSMARLFNTDPIQIMVSRRIYSKGCLQARISASYWTPIFAPKGYWTGKTGMRLWTRAGTKMLFAVCWLMSFYGCLLWYVFVCIELRCSSCAIGGSEYSCIHASMHPCIDASMHPRLHASMYPLYMHSFIHASMHLCIPASMHPCNHVCIHASMHSSCMYGLCIHASRHGCS